MPESTEKLEILSMIREGVITPEQGVRLLEAIDNADTSPDEAAAAPSHEPRWLNIEINHRSGTRIKSLTPIRIPFSIIRMFFKFIPAGSLRDFDAEEILDSLKSGRPLELLDDAAGRSVRIFAE